MQIFSGGSQMYTVNINSDWLLWVSLHQCSEMVARCRENELQRHGISVMQSALMLCIIQIGKPAKIAEICRHLKREAPTVAIMVNRMVKHGLLEEIKNGEKSRGKSYQVTDKGITALNNSKSSDCLKKIFYTLTEKEKKLMINLSKSILRNSIEAYYGAKASKYY